MMRWAVFCAGDGRRGVAPATGPRPAIATMKTLLAAAALALLAFAAESCGQTGSRAETIQFSPGESRATGGRRAAASPGKPFDATLELKGIRFRVTATNEGSINRLHIVPSGLEIDNRAIEKAIDGSVTAAEVADINADGSPEIYVYVTSAGSGSYGSLVAYSANRRKSLSEIYLPPVAENAAAAKGYMGHDEFAVVETTFVQRFPVYRGGDTNDHPTGGTRQLQYKLVPSEAGWRLRLDRTVEH
jgi:hypothetical protein